jgi:oligosaccharide repeat unit polymerase
MIIRLYSIEFFFAIAFILFLSGYFYTGDLVQYKIGSVALILHGVAFFSFIFGVVIASFLDSGSNHKANSKKELVIGRGFYAFSYLVSFLGILIAVLQIQATTSIIVYFELLFSGYDSNLRESFLLSSKEGGLPGVVKMFANTPLAVFLLVCGVIFFFNIDKKNKTKLKFLLMFSFLMLSVKVFLSLDRMSIFAVAFPVIIYFFKYRLYLKLYPYFLLLFIIFFLNYISSKRLEGYNIFDFLALYFNLGLVNLELVHNSLTNYSYGFQTIFAPLVFIGRFFGFDLESDQGFFWEWNPAQYSVGYAFMDFGYFYFCFFIFLGFFSRFLTRAAYSGSIIGASSYFVFFYGLMSFVTVPVIRGLEFYVAVLISTIIPYFFCRVK